jgi:hypothetical protein
MVGADSAFPRPDDGVDTAVHGRGMMDVYE